MARRQAVLARCLAHGLAPGDRPLVLLSGGETTVTVRGGGRGGRNTEYLLAFGLALEGTAGVFALAADTDGIDGIEDNAGAVLRPSSLVEAAQKGISGAERLADNDAYGFFDMLGDLLFTGPTLTNVNDFRAIAIPAFSHCSGYVGIRAMTLISKSKPASQVTPTAVQLG